MPGDQVDCIVPGGGVRRQLVELQEETFPQVPCTDSDRFELLHARQCCLHFVGRDAWRIECVGERLGDILEIHLQHAVGVDGFDDRCRDEFPPGCHRREIQLPQEVVGEGLGGGVVELHAIGQSRSGWS